MMYRLNITFIAALLFTVLLFSARELKAQEKSEFREYEDTLAVLSDIIFNGPDDNSKFVANEIFLTLMEEALSLNNSFRYPFDSLKTVSIQTSPDKRFRIITWMIAIENGSYQYFGFIQSYSLKGNGYEVYQLIDIHDKDDSPEMKIFDHKNWYGAIYYDIIITRHNGVRYYTLLGWDGYSSLVRRKVIEVLTLRSNGMPKFGQSLFKYDIPHQKRVIFEYSSLASMNLKYEKQHYYIQRKLIFYNPKPSYTPQKPVDNHTGRQRLLGRIKASRGRTLTKPKAPKGYRLSRKASEMIVFDNLIPMRQSLEGQAQYYVPEGNIVCGLVFKNGRWKYIEDIDARNPAHRYDKPSKRPKPEKGL